MSSPGFLLRIAFLRRINISMTRLSNNGNGTKIGSLDLPQHNFNKIFVLRLICSRRARLKRSNVSIKDRVTTLPAFKVISFGFTTSGHRCGACPPEHFGGLGGLRQLDGTPKDSEWHAFCECPGTSTARNIFCLNANLEISCSDPCSVQDLCKLVRSVADSAFLSGKCASFAYDIRCTRRKLFRRLSADGPSGRAVVAARPVAAQR